jgi:hypothetical protein
VILGTVYIPGFSRTSQGEWVLEPLISEVDAEARHVILGSTCQMPIWAGCPTLTSITYVPFGETYDKIGTIQRRLAWPLHKDDTLVQSGSATADNIFWALTFSHIARRVIYLPERRYGRALKL